MSEEEWDWEIGQTEAEDTTYDNGNSNGNNNNSNGNSNNNSNGRVKSKNSVSPTNRNKSNGMTNNNTNSNTNTNNVDPKQIALSVGSKSLQKGITSSPSFQELERAIGATLALSLNSENAQGNNSNDSLKTGLVSSTSANKLMNQKFASNQQIHRKGKQQQYQSHDDQDQSHVHTSSSPTQRQSKTNHLEITDRTKTELNAFINESESRALILFHSPTISPVSVRDACSKYGVLYYIRPEFHGKGVTFLSYFDLRSAIHAFGSIKEELGADAAASVHYSVMLHAANNNTEEFRLIVRHFPEGRPESEIQSIFSRYGQLRSIQRTFGVDETESTVDPTAANDSSAYSIEYYNIQDARLAASELSATSAQMWGPKTIINSASLDSRKQQLCRQLLATLSRWRTEMAARNNISTASPYIPMAMVGAQGMYGNSMYGNGAQQAGQVSILLPPGYVQNTMQMPMQMPMQMYGIAYHPNQTQMQPHMAFDPHYQMALSNGARVPDNGTDRTILDSTRVPIQKVNPDWQSSPTQGHVKMLDGYNVSNLVSYHQSRIQGKGHTFDNNQRPLYHNGGHAQNRARIKLNAPAPDIDFALDMNKIAEGSETRTTVMVRNIPNKYSQQMLLEEVNINHKGTYDFFYLPIDFKNKCNVGYCFINFLEPKYIQPFIEEFNGQRWKSFNSEKVCAVSYARIQGKGAMVARFQNSSLLEKDGEYRPLLFISSGPDKGTPEPFPSNVNYRRQTKLDQEDDLNNNHDNITNDTENYSSA